MDQRLKQLDPSKVRRVQTIKWKFYWYAVIAAINQAIAGTFVAYATSVLDPLVGAVFLSLTLVANSLSGLLITNLIYRRLGFKASKLVGMWGNAFVVTGLYFAVICQNPSIAWIVAIAAGIFGGITVTIWWTAQAVFIQQVCEAIAAEIETLPLDNNPDIELQILSNGDTSKASITPDKMLQASLTALEIAQNEISGRWTAIYLSVDMTVCLILSIIPITANISMDVIFIMLPILGVSTALLGSTFESFDLHENLNPMTWKEYKREIGAVSSQFYTDSRITLFSFFFIETIFTAVMFAGYVNNVVFAEKLGLKQLGFLVAFCDFVAIVSSFAYVSFINKFQAGLHWVMQFGVCSYVLCGALVFMLSVDKLGSLPIALLLQVLSGLGRGVVEGPSRAAYCKVFQGEDLATAYAGQQLIFGVGGGVAILIYGFVSKEVIGSIVAITGMIALATYGLFMCLENVKQKLPWGDLCRIICQFLSNQSRKKL